MQNQPFRSVAPQKSMPQSTAHSNHTMATPLGIAELLEAILLQVDVKTVLLSQAVNKDFQSTIKESIKLQQKLFLVAVLDDGRKHEFNPLLMANHAFEEGYDELVPTFQWCNRNGLIITDKCRELEREYFTRHEPVKEGSWQRMHLGQPPLPYGYLAYQLYGPVLKREHHFIEGNANRKAGWYHEQVLERRGLVWRSQDLRMLRRDAERLETQTERSTK